MNIGSKLRVDRLEVTLVHFSDAERQAHCGERCMIYAVFGRKQFIQRALKRLIGHRESRADIVADTIL